MKRTLLTTAAAIALALPPFPTMPQDQDPRQDATDATRQANSALRDELPFDDTTDFDDASRGLIAPLPAGMIETADGAPVWDPQKYDFIAADAAAPDTVNPSLWRMSQLINVGGFFEVTDGIYQVRNMDLSNMTIIEGTEGTPSSTR